MMYIIDNMIMIHVFFVCMKYNKLWKINTIYNCVNLHENDKTDSPILIVLQNIIICTLMFNWLTHIHEYKTKSQILDTHTHIHITI